MISNVTRSQVNSLSALGVDVGQSTVLASGTIFVKPGRYPGFYDARLGLYIYHDGTIEQVGGR